MSDELRIARQWLAKAMNDLLNADNNLAASEVPFDTVCFHCQQAAEKLLKAYLVANGQPAPRTHDLFLLLEQVLSLNAAAEQLREALSILAPYAVEIRYPDDWFMPAEEDAKEARGAARQVVNWLQTARADIFPSPPSS